MAGNILPAAAMMGTVALFAGGCTGAERRVTPDLYSVATDGALLPAATTESMTFITLNTAHGRGNGFHQLLQSTRRHRQNLDRIHAVIAREQPAVVGLQEADGICAWSGGFDHVRYLAEQGGFAQFVRGELVNTRGLSHGIALMSAVEMADPLTVTFEPAPGATPKGFVISTIGWPGRPGVTIDVLSVHLEAFRPKLRELQVAEMIDTLKDRNRPVILMGDLNTSWTGKRNVLPQLAEALELTAFDPTSEAHASLPVFGRRLDWILISEEFEFVRYETLPDVLSDHRAVVAEIALRELPVMAENTLLPSTAGD